MKGKQIKLVFSFALVQLILLFSVQHYFAPAAQSSVKALTICKAADLPGDYSEIPELDELLLDEEKGDERSHPFSRFMDVQAAFGFNRFQFFNNSYGVHPEPSRKAHLPTYLFKRVLLI